MRLITILIECVRRGLIWFCHIIRCDTSHPLSSATQCYTSRTKRLRCTQSYGFHSERWGGRKGTRETDNIVIECNYNKLMLATICDCDWTTICHYTVRTSLPKICKSPNSPAFTMVSTDKAIKHFIVPFSACCRRILNHFVNVWPRVNGWIVCWLTGYCCCYVAVASPISIYPIISFICEPTTITNRRRLLNEEKNKWKELKSIYGDCVCVCALLVLVFSGNYYWKSTSWPARIYDVRVRTAIGNLKTWSQLEYYGI